MSNKGLTQKSAPAASVSVVEDRDVQGLFIKKLQLQEGAKAIVRFLTDGRDVIDDTFHRQVPKQVKTTIFKTDVLCTLPNGSCKHCDEGLYKTAKMFLTWVWVEKIFYKNKPNAQYNPTALEKDDEGSEYWVEEVNGPMVWQQTMGKGFYLYNQLTSIYRQNKSLRIGKFTISRTGSGIDTTYSIMPVMSSFTTDERHMPDELVAMSENLPDLEKFAAGKLTKIPFSVLGISPEDSQKVQKVTTKRSVPQELDDDDLTSKLIDPLADELDDISTIF